MRQKQRERAREVAERESSELRGDNCSRVEKEDVRKYDRAMRLHGPSLNCARKLDLAPSRVAIGLDSKWQTKQDKSEIETAKESVMSSLAATCAQSDR